MLSPKAQFPLGRPWAASNAPKVPMSRTVPPPEPNPDGPHVLEYEKWKTPLEVGKFYKVADPLHPSGFKCLPCGTVEIRECRPHNGGAKLYCAHGREKPKCMLCKEIGGGSSNCSCGVRRFRCPLHKGTDDGVLFAEMARMSANNAAEEAVDAEDSGKEDNVGSLEVVAHEDGADAVEEYRKVMAGLRKPRMSLSDLEGTMQERVQLKRKAASSDPPLKRVRSADAASQFIPPIADIEDMVAATALEGPGASCAASEAMHEL